MGCRRRLPPPPALDTSRRGATDHAARVGACGEADWKGAEARGGTLAPRPFPSKKNSPAHPPPPPAPLPARHRGRRLRRRPPPGRRQHALLRLLPRLWRRALLAVPRRRHCRVRRQVRARGGRVPQMLGRALRGVPGVWGAVCAAPVCSFTRTAGGGGRCVGRRVRRRQRPARLVWVRRAADAAGLERERVLHPIFGSIRALESERERALFFFPFFSVVVPFFFAAPFFPPTFFLLPHFFLHTTLHTCTRWRFPHGPGDLFFYVPTLHFLPPPSTARPGGNSAVFFLLCACRFFCCCKNHQIENSSEIKIHIDQNEKTHSLISLTAAPPPRRRPTRTLRCARTPPAPPARPPGAAPACRQRRCGRAGRPGRSRPTNRRTAPTPRAARPAAQSGTGRRARRPGGGVRKRRGCRWWGLKRLGGGWKKRKKKLASIRALLTPLSFPTHHTGPHSPDPAPPWRRAGPGRGV